MTIYGFIEDCDIIFLYNGYSDNGYSIILDIVILISPSIFPHLHIRHTKFIGYSDILVIVILAVNFCPQRYHNIRYIL